MRIFWSNVTEEYSRGTAWTASIRTICPHCDEENMFYTQLRDNQCKFCRGKMPFPSSMVKIVKKRVEYHVATEAE